MNKKVALVLSGGSARGIAHIGVIEELEKRNYEIASIAGTSMGAVVGAFYAMGSLTVFKEFLLTLDKRKTFQLLDFSMGTLGLVKGNKLFSTLKSIVPDQLIETLKIPFAAVATDIINKKEVVFTQGSVYDALRASVAIPSFLTPIKTNDGLLVDGSIMNNIPINRVNRSVNDLLFAVDVGADVPKLELEKTKQEVKLQEADYKEKINDFNKQVTKVTTNKNIVEHMGFVSLFDTVINLMIDQISTMHMEKYKPDVLIEISRENFSAFDFFKAKEIIEIGRLAASKALDNYEINNLHQWHINDLTQQSLKS